MKNTKNFHVKVDLRSRGLACYFARVVRTKMRATQDGALLYSSRRNSVWLQACYDHTNDLYFNFEIVFYDCKPTSLCQVARPSPKEMWAHDTGNDWTTFTIKCDASR